MNRVLALLAVILIVTTACAAKSTISDADIDATVQAALAATLTAQPTATPVPPLTATPTLQPTDTPQPSPTHTATPRPRPTNTPAPTATPTSTASATASPTPFSKEAYQASANTALDYREVNKSDRYQGEIICWKGKVFNIDETNGTTGFQAYYFEGRHAADGDNAFVVIYNGVLPDVYEDTEILACGEVGEKFSGTNAFGGEISQPRLIAKFVDLWVPEPLAPTATPVPPTPLPMVDNLGVQKQVGQWGLKLYNVKRAKAVYFFDNAQIAQGVWLLSFVEFTNLGTGTRSPWEDLDFYYLDDQGRTYEANYNDAWLGARWQFQAGDIMDDIQPGSLLGVVLPIDSPENLSNVWLRVEQDPNFAIYLGNAGTIPVE